MLYVEKNPEEKNPESDRTVSRCRNVYYSSYAIFDQQILSFKKTYKISLPLRIEICYE